MAIKQRHALVTVFLILIICVSLVNVRSARADEGTPTEPPAATEAATQPPVEETPVSVEVYPGSRRGNTLSGDKRRGKRSRGDYVH